MSSPRARREPSPSTTRTRCGLHDQTDAARCGHASSVATGPEVAPRRLVDVHPREEVSRRRVRVNLGELLFDGIPDERADVVADRRTVLRRDRLRSAPGGGVDVDVRRLLRSAAGVAALPVGAGCSLLGQDLALLDPLLDVGDLTGSSPLLGQGALHLADELQSLAPDGEGFRCFLYPAADGTPVDVVQWWSGRNLDQEVEVVEKLTERARLSDVGGLPAASAVAAKR